VTWVESMYGLDLGLRHNIRGLGYKGEVIWSRDEGLR